MSDRLAHRQYGERLYLKTIRANYDGCLKAKSLGESEQAVRVAAALRVD